MTQAAFNRAAAHLLRQGARSLDSDGVTCLLRGAQGRMCPVGALIPDSEYRADMEGCIPETPALEGIDRALLFGLREIHDQADPSERRGLLRELAEGHGLDASFIG